MISIRYCGVCGDQNFVEKIKEELLDKTSVQEEEIQELECGSCSMEIKLEEETVFSEEEDFLDIGRVTENVKSAMNSKT